MSFMKKLALLFALVVAALCVGGVAKAQAYACTVSQLSQPMLTWYSATDEVQVQFETWQDCTMADAVDNRVDINLLVWNGSSYQNIYSNRGWMGCSRNDWANPYAGRSSCPNIGITETPATHDHLYVIFVEQPDIFVGCCEYWLATATYSHHDHNGVLHSYTLSSGASGSGYRQNPNVTPTSWAY